MSRLVIFVIVCIGIAHSREITETVDLRPQYTFSYEVKDPTTGDIKNQIESRDGDVVKGSYSLVDPDGLIRVVQYSSDAENGFNAIVSRTPIGKQVVAAAIPSIVKSVPIVQQPTLIRSIPNIIQGPSLIRSEPNIIQSSGLLRGIPSIGSQLSLGSLLSGAYASSNLIRAPQSLGISLSGLKSSSLIY